MCRALATRAVFTHKPLLSLVQPTVDGLTIPTGDPHPAL
ncbi:MAG: hypothetical protein AVDCRST_MAG93-3882 [uncultured Chloroflexia bacterium]|uniref:Uncharacterized protein n=1 Tax=uncultured Chloroflexia bacterium TaxID=1672391 RepID=A0A6J4JY65_9CHLR|nr:MAG: hypothetical protein AVDCRST_MAG93-3882 [uncultured Chloroflexia bacterium]